MDVQDSLKNPKSFWFAERILFIGTLVAFFIFTGLLMLAERHHAAAQSFLSSFFNIVSVGTLTGLFRGDSGSLTFNGQLVLLLDMIVSGLIASFVSILLIIFVRLGFDRKETLRGEIEKIGAHTKGILAFIFLDLLFIWGLGTLLLRVSGSHNLWEAAFNAASHIFNDGVTARTNNMIPYAHNTAMLLSGAFLITIGGLGISIRGYVYKHIFKLLRLRRLTQAIPDAVLAPKNFIIAVLLVTAALQVFGAISMYAFEMHHASIFTSALTAHTKFLDTYYMSVSARTAGFTVFPNLALLHDKSNIILMLLMTVGAAPGSFAGGVFKLTAFIYLLVFMGSRLRGDQQISTPRRYLHFTQRTAIEANFRIIGFTLILLALVLLLFFVQPNVSGSHLLFESISAVSNTGLTLGATPLLGTMGMLIIIALMIVGKVGFISTVISFFPKYQRAIEATTTDEEGLPVD